jgi:catechol 2,3-dioxygenase-like lactoylglutathione lyase family enzyme
MAAIRYIVDDVERAIGFYRDLLGFEVEMHPAPGFAALTRGDLRLYLNTPGAGGAGRAGGVPQPGGWNRFQLEVRDLDALVDALRAAGTRFRGDRVEGQGGAQILVEDPAGNAVELFEPGARPRQGRADPLPDGRPDQPRTA